MTDDSNVTDAINNSLSQDGARIAATVEPLLACMHALSWISRHLHPGTLERLISQSDAPVDQVRAAQADIATWPDHLTPLGQQLDRVCVCVLRAFEELDAVPSGEQAIMFTYRAIRHLPKAMEALYPLAGIFPPISRFFLDAEFQLDTALIDRLSGIAPDNTGVLAVGKDRDHRSTVWMYVPESEDTDTPRPLIVALHGGSGTGRGFLWSWLRTARSHGALLAAPSSLGSTWALQGQDIDSPRLTEIVAFMADKWRVDPRRILLTGMSDGGTFSYVSGLKKESPFTHLAPFSAAFHPMLGSFADKDRLQGLPVHITHGALDWMFPKDLAHMAHEWLQQAGARVTCRVIDDLSHTYAAELNGDIMAWMNSTSASPGGA